MSRVTAGPLTVKQVTLPWAHVYPRGGSSDASNREMLCIFRNRSKSGP